MSHIYKAQVEIKDIIPAIMREAIFLIAKALNTRISSENIIYDYYGNRHTLNDDWVVLEYNLYNNAKNIAINIKTGEVRADFYQNRYLQDRLLKMIKDTYIGILAMKQIQSQLYTYSSNINVFENKVEILLEVEV